MEKIRAAERWLLAAEKGLLTAFMLTMALLSFLQVILRGLFSSGILWGDTFLRYLVLWVGFLGAGVAAAEDKQFALDLAPRLFSGRGRHALHAALHLFTAGVCYVLARASWLVLAEEYKAGRILFSAGGTQIPAWALETIIPGGFLLLLVHYALRLAASAAELRR